MLSLVTLWNLWWAVCTLVGCTSLLTYFVPWFVLIFAGDQDLKKKYGEDKTKWALVTGTHPSPSTPSLPSPPLSTSTSTFTTTKTGGSSGIGRAIVEKLASQGLNVVVVAYPDALLDSSVAEYKKAHPTLEFRAVGLNLAGTDFLPALVEATKDIDVSLLFNNAGYIKTGFFTTTPLAAGVANHHCNATSVVQITHHFVSKMQEKGLKGCVTFTSSPAGFMPTPFSVLYGATKCYLTEFAMSLAPEVREDGIDVCVVHPSPVESNFYQGTHSLDALAFFRATATGPQTISNALFRTVGRSCVCDQGYYPPSVRVLTKLVDVNLLADIIARTAHTMKDFKEIKAADATKAKKGN